MTDRCGLCGCTETFGGSWAPERCCRCGAIENVKGGWYHDESARPTDAEIHQRWAENLKSNADIRQHEPKRLSSLGSGDWFNRKGMLYRVIDHDPAGGVWFKEHGPDGQMMCLVLDIDNGAQSYLHPDTLVTRVYVKVSTVPFK